MVKASIRAFTLVNGLLLLLALITWGITSKSYEAVDYIGSISSVAFTVVLIVGIRTNRIQRTSDE